MMYPRCTCGELLCNKQIEYEKRMRQICSELQLDFDTISQGIDQTEEYKIARSNIVNELCKRWCCKQQMITYVDIVNIVK